MRYDVICVGGGLNYVGAIFLARGGKKVLLIEKDLKHLGGTCLNNGCIPSKNLFHRTQVIYESEEEVFEGSININLKKLSKKIYEDISVLVEEITSQCKRSGIEIVEGEAFVIDKNRIKVDDNVYESDFIIIGSGARAYIPAGIDMDYHHIISSDEALKLEKFPKEIFIYGSGAIGLEFASYFAINGVKTNLLYRHESISSKIHPKIVSKIETQLSELGINLLPNTVVQKAFTKDNKVHIETDKDTFVTEKFLVATGRVVNSDVIQTDNIQIVKNAVKTDEYFKTTSENIFAIGDCNGKLKLAHAARKQAINVANQIMGKKELLNLSNIPRFIFTMPLSYASVGKKSEKEVLLSLSSLGITGSVKGAINGLAVLYADKDDFISGAEIFMPNAQELISVISTILAGEMDKKTLLEATFAHPTFSEVFDYITRRLR